MTEEQAQEIDTRADNEVEDAVQFSEESAEPGEEWIRQSAVYAAHIPVDPPIHGE